MAAYADLHVHTTNSDGAFEIDELPGAARRAGVEVVAVTDHDRVHPALREPVSTVDGLTLIHGVELKVEADERIDLLGYGVVRTPELEAELDRLQRDRVERGAAIVERVEDRLGIDLDVEARRGIGRPHIARAVADHPDAPYDVQETFDHLIGDGRPCFVPRDVTSFDRGRELLTSACAIVGLAHPLRYDDPEAALERARGLDAIERWYPYDFDADPGIVDRTAEEAGLLLTGGSDAHGDRLGRAGASASAYRRIAARLPDPT